MALELRVLGPPKVLVNDREVAVTGRPLQLLVRLALAHPVPLLPHRLVQDLWGDGSGSVGALRVTVGRARQMVGQEELLWTDRGYSLRACEIDIRRFEQLAHGGRDRSNSIDHRIRSFENALAEWGGEPFSGMTGAAWIEGERLRFEELLEEIEDERFELLLLGNGHAAAALQLRKALNRAPTREHRAEMLAVALYRCGRQAEALQVITSTRHNLLEHLGLDLGPDLRSVETRILQQDPRLAVPELTAMQLTEEEVEARLRAATALLQAGVYSETRAIIDEAEEVARNSGHRRPLCHALIARSQLCLWSGEGDPDEPLAAARRIARQIRDGQLLARCALTDFSRGLNLDEPSVLVGLLEPIPLLPPTAREVVQLLCCAAAVVMFGNGSDSSQRLLEQARRIHSVASSDHSTALVLVLASIRSSVDGLELQRSALEAETAFEIARNLDDAPLLVVCSQAAIRAAYLRGDLNQVDQLLEGLAGASVQALMPFGVVREALCRTSNALARGEVGEAERRWAESVTLGRRLRTHVTETAAQSQRLMLMLEADRLDEIGSVASMVLPTRTQPSIWNALSALASADEIDALVGVLPDLRRDDSFAATIAVAALAASEHRHPTLAQACLQYLEGSGDRTVVIGLGTIVMGHCDHFRGLALAASDRWAEALECFSGSASRSLAQGLWLWWAASTVEGAGVAAAMGDCHGALSMLALVQDHPVFGESARLRRRVNEVLASLQLPAA